jgi:hypothetical protein
VNDIIAGDPAPTNPTSRLRDDILAGLRAAESGSVGDETPEDLLDAYRAEVLVEAADFFEGVLKETLHPEKDARYWSAVHDMVRGLRCRAEAGESRG